jgi:hypothetical protein
MTTMFRAFVLALVFLTALAGVATAQTLNAGQVLLASSMLTGQDLGQAEEESTTASVEEDSAPISGFIKVEGRDKYLGANGAIFHPDPGTVLQLDLSWRGWYADLWVLHSGGDWKSTFGHEVDYTIGRSGEIGNYSYDIGVAYFDIVGEETGLEDVLDPYLKISRSFDWGVPYFKFEHYYPVSGSLPGSGQQYHLGVTFAGSIGNRDRWSWSSTVDSFYDTGAFDFNAGVLGSVTGTLTYNLGAISVGPSAKWITPISSMNDGREGDTMLSLAITHNF